MQIQKDYPSQNYLELKFSNKDLKELNQEEALQKYQQNAKIIGQIFSKEFDENLVEEKQQETNQIQALQKDILVSKKIEDFKDDYLKMKEKYALRLEEFEKKNEFYHELMKEAKTLKNNDFENFKNKLKQEQFYAKDFPFFYEESPYYFSATDEIIKKIDCTSQIKVWEPNENIALYQL